MVLPSVLTHRPMPPKIRIGRRRGRQRLLGGSRLAVIRCLADEIMSSEATVLVSAFVGGVGAAVARQMNMERP